MTWQNRAPHVREPIGYLRHFFLPPSETFIFTSMRSLTRYAPRVFAIARREPVKHPWDDVTALRSLRGGWWNNSGHLCRSSRRQKYAPDFRADNVGFRVAMEVES